MYFSRKVPKAWEPFDGSHTLRTTFVPDRFLLDLAYEHKGVFSPRFRQFPAVSGGGEWLEKLVEKIVLVGALNRNLKYCLFSYFINLNNY